MDNSIEISPDNTGSQNRQALQHALDQGGTIRLKTPGTYLLDKTLFIGSHTSLICGGGVVFKKDSQAEPFTHVFLNKGALTKRWDENICIKGLTIEVNGVDVRNFLIYGLHGQLAFHYAKDVKIDRFRCLDLGPAQYGIHVCTFEDILIQDVHIEGDKDGVHLGRGKRFTIRDGVFNTYDDAVALNGHDYSTGNPELGWIEDGLIENCFDLDADKGVGYFCRILAGGWTDWQEGMEVQQSDTVVSGGRLYRVQMKPDGISYKSLTRPDHTEGSREYDGITWGVVQEGEVYGAGVRNVTFRDINLYKGRTAFSIHFDNDKFSRSYYPGAPVPVQQNIRLENIRVLHDYGTDFLRINTPVDRVAIMNSDLGENPLRFLSNNAMDKYGPTDLFISGCSLPVSPEKLLKREFEGKEIRLLEGTNIID